MYSGSVADEAYSNIRQILGNAIGRRIVDITQHDKEDFDQDGKCFVMFMLEDGHYIRFDLGEDSGIGHDIEPS